MSSSATSAMDVHEAFTNWTVSQAVKINGIAAHKFPGRGLGIIAEKDFKEGDTILTVPTSALRTLLNVSKSTSGPIGPITVHGLLAASLSLDTTPQYSTWRAVLPTPESFKESVPLLWDASLQALLPAAALALLTNQQRKLSLDWTSVTAAFPNLSYEVFTYNWLLVNTRTFYFTSPHIKLAKPINRDDCMALQPFADYFNHTDVASAEALFSSQGYTFSTCCSIKKGDEIYISYGNHSNDFLLAEYGFLMESNKWDEVALDEFVMPMFDSKQRAVLEEAGFRGKYVLDGDGVCYRTQIALRLLCLPYRQWQLLVSNGLEEGDNYQRKVNVILLKVLEEMFEGADEKLKSVKLLEYGLSSQRETLGRRWSQIRLLILTSMRRIDS